MKILYYDCFSGISGDMNLGVLIDLGVDPEYLKSELKKLNVSGYELEISRKLKMGIEGTRVNVKLEHHHHNHTGSNHGHHHHHHEPHRHLKDIKKLIYESKLSERVKEKSLDIFQRIGVAEAKIHGKTVEEIHFHEVGAIDSIVDIVGAAICLENLGVDKIMASRVEVGGGMVRCAHGVFPVPAPATAEILRNIPIRKGSVQSETTTPTGAAILASYVNEFTDKVDFSITKTGYGIGHKDFDIPNVLRAHLAEAKETSAEQTISYLTECNIDDMNPEWYDYVMEKLFEAGAEDVFYTPIQMKKGRPAVKLSILHDEKRSEAIKSLLFRHTSTIGLRKTKVQKTMLQREEKKLQTKYGEITIKYTVIDDGNRKWKPEYEDCKRIAEKHNISLQEIYNEINLNIHD
ncbi:MAG: nickel pincer cofactor biosynthesis protein LarC [Bacteroidota bacterium]